MSLEKIYTLSIGFVSYVVGWLMSYYDIGRSFHVGKIASQICLFDNREKLSVVGCSLQIYGLWYYIGLLFKLVFLNKMTLTREFGILFGIVGLLFFFIVRIISYIIKWLFH